MIFSLWRAYIVYRINTLNNPLANKIIQGESATKVKKVKSQFNPNATYSSNKGGRPFISKSPKVKVTTSNSQLFLRYVETSEIYDN